MYRFIVPTYLIAVVLIMTSCSAVSTTARTVGTVGSVGWKAAKITGKTAYHTGNVAYKTGKFTSKAVRGVVYMGKGKQLVPLIKQGNSMYVNVKINGKASGRLLLDTGASLTQISQRLAKKLKIKKKDGVPLEVRIANGQIVGGRRVNLKEIRIKGVRVTDVTAVVLDHEIPGESDGLLGMSFLKHFSFEIDSEKGELLLQQKAL